MSFVTALPPDPNRPPSKVCKPFPKGATFKERHPAIVASLRLRNSPAIRMSSSVSTDNSSSRSEPKQTARVQSAPVVEEGRIEGFDDTPDSWEDIEVDVPCVDSLNIPHYEEDVDCDTYEYDSEYVETKIKSIVLSDSSMYPGSYYPHPTLDDIESNPPPEVLSVTQVLAYVREIHIKNTNLCSDVRDSHDLMGTDLPNQVCADCATDVSHTSNSAPPDLPAEDGPPDPPTEDLHNSSEPPIHIQLYHMTGQIDLISLITDDYDSDNIAEGLANRYEGDELTCIYGPTHIPCFVDTIVDMEYSPSTNMLVLHTGTTRPLHTSRPPPGPPKPTAPHKCHQRNLLKRKKDRTKISSHCPHRVLRYIRYRPARNRKITAYYVPCNHVYDMTPEDDIELSARLTDIEHAFTPHSGCESLDHVAVTLIEPYTWFQRLAMHPDADNFCAANPHLEQTKCFDDFLMGAHLMIAFMIFTGVTIWIVGMRITEFVVELFERQIRRPRFQVHMHTEIIAPPNAEPDRRSWLYKLVSAVSLTYVTSFLILFSEPIVNYTVKQMRKWWNDAAFYGRVNNKVQEVRADFERWKEGFANFSLQKMSDKDTLLIVNIKNVLHLIYHVYNGNKGSAIERATDLAVSCPHILAAAISIPYDAIGAAVGNPRAEVEIAGAPLVLDRDQWAQVLEHYHQHGNLDALNVNDFRVQAGGASLISIISGALSHWKMDGLSAEDIKHANNQFTFIRNSRAAVEDVLSSAQVLISVIARTLFNVDPFDASYQKFCGKMVDVIEFANGTAIYTEEIMSDKDAMIGVKRMHAEASLLLVDPLLNTAPKYLYNAFMTAHRSLAATSVRATAFLKGADERVEPLMIFMTGPPKVGKSAFIKFAMKSICVLDKVECDPTTIFFKSPDSEYWEGFHRPKFTVMDDIFKSTDSQTRAREASDVIGMINTIPYSLNMAFEGKGNTYFQSDYVFASTNLCNDGIASAKFVIGLADPSAFVRRLHIVLHRSDRLVGRDKDAIKENTYRVDACPLPEYIGQTLDSVALIKMIHAVRTDQVAQQAAYDYTPEELQELFDVQVFKFNDYSPLDLFLKCTQLKLYSWSDTEMYPYYIALFAIIMCAAVASPLYNYLFPFETHSIHAKWKESRNHIRGGRHVNYKRAGHNAAQKHMERDGNHNVHSGELSYHRSLISNVHKSIVYLGARATNPPQGEKTPYSTCHGIHLRDGVIMTCGHWLTPASRQPDMTLFLANQGESYKTPFPKLDDIYFAENMDMAFFRMDKSVPLPPEGLKYYVKYADACDLPNGHPMQMVYTQVDGLPVVRSLHKAPNTAPVTYRHEGELYFIEEPIGYFEKTVAGQSGALVAVEGPQGRPQIVGMHVGVNWSITNREVSVAVPLTFDGLDEVVSLMVGQKGNEFKVHTAFEQTTPVSVKEQYDPIDPALLTYVGRDFPLPVFDTVPVSRAHHVAQVTKIKRSDLFAWNGPPTAIPARLKTFVRDNVCYNPLNIALAKVTTAHWPHMELPNATMAYAKSMYPRPTKKPLLLDLDQAANGIPELSIPGVHLATSAGYPFTLSGSGVKGKAPFLVRDPCGNVKYQPEFRRHMESLLVDFQSGKNMNVIWADSLKDETRDIGKVEIGKSRLISSSPVDYLLMLRIYFASFIAFVQSTPASKPVSVGINPHGIDWARLYNRMSKHKGSTISGDFTNYDSKVPKFMVDKFVELVNWWYDDGPVNAEIRRMLMVHISEAHHIVGVLIYVAMGGQPSGNGLTSVMNSIIGMMMGHFVLTECLHLTHDEFEMCMYGDDSIFTIARPGIRCSDMAPHYYKHFGMTFNHWTKEKNDTFDTMATISYLGRMFVLENGFVLAPLTMDTIVQSTYWRRGDTNKDMVLLSTTDSYFIELSHHSEEVFNEYTRKLILAVHDRARHLEDAISSRTNDYWFYQTRKYSPDQAHRPIKPYYTDDFTVHSGAARLADPSQSFVDETRHTEFTERAANDLPPTQLGQLGEMHDAGPVLNSAVDSNLVMDPHKSFNMEVFDLNGALNRTYPMANLNWLSSQAENTTLVTYNLPDILFAQNFIAEKIRDFRYFRAGIRFTFRVTTNKFLYGKIIAYYEPLPYLDSFPITSHYAATGSPHVLVSASAGEAVTFDIPFVSFQRALDIPSYTAAEMGRVVIKVFNPLTTMTTAVADADIFVTAQFLDAELMLPHSRITTASLAVGAEYVQDFEVHSGKSHFGLPAKEMRAKSAAGHIGSILEDQNPGKGIIRSVPLVRQYADTFKTYVAPVIATLGMLGLSKPMTTSINTIVKSNPFSDMIYGKGVDLTQKMAMDPENGITTAPIVAGISVDEMELMKLMGTPQMVGQYGFVASTPATAIGVAGPFDYQPCFVDNVCRMFSWRRGSYKFKIYITASLFHTAKFVLWLTDDVDTTTDWQSCYHKIIDVQGDTEIEFTVPYCEKRVATSNASGTTFGIYAKPMAWSTPDPSLSTPIYFNVYKSAASDFRVAGLREQFFTPTHNPRADFAQDFPMFQDGMTGYDTQGLLFGEEYTTVREIIHRYTPLYATASSQTLVWPGVQSGAFITGVQLWSLFYRFWRGSNRYKFLVKNNTHVECISVAMATGDFPGAYMTSPNNALLEAEVPYYYDALFQSTTVQGTPVLNMSTLGSKYLFRAAGDDFSFHWIRALPAGTFSGPAGGTGAAGLRTFLST
jgi:hypothetical protein